MNVRGGVQWPLVLGARAPAFAPRQGLQYADGAEQYSAKIAQNTLDMLALRPRNLSVQGRFRFPNLLRGELDHLFPRSDSKSELHRASSPTQMHLFMRAVEPI